MTRKRAVERRLEDIEPDDGPTPAGLPQLTVRDIFINLNDETMSPEWIDRSRQIMRINGGPHYVPDAIFEVFYQ
jgi:hypothetical protein